MHLALRKKEIASENPATVAHLYIIFYILSLSKNFEFITNVRRLRSIFEQLIGRSESLVKVSKFHNSNKLQLMNVRLYDSLQ